MNPEHSNLFLNEKELILGSYTEKPYVLTKFIVTLSEGVLTSIDIQNFLEMGLHIVRLKMNRITRADKVKFLDMINCAVRLACEKYYVSTWPIATCLDIPNTWMKTGDIDMGIYASTVFIKNDTIVEITSDVKFWNKCTATRVFIDDPCIIKSITPGTEITIISCHIVMFCTEVVDTKTIKCTVVREGHLGNNEYVCARGVKLVGPPLTKKDCELIEFAKEFKLNILTMQLMRLPSTVQKVREMFDGGPVPLILSTICDQEGLDNIDEIIEVSDGIILGREFLAYTIANKHEMTAIQLQVSGKCRKAGKPFFISGQILENTLLEGTLSPVDLSDVTNAVMQGAGFVLSHRYDSPANILQAIDILNKVCRFVESLALDDLFWRLSLEFQLPVNAAEACVLACALTVKQTGAYVVVLPTVTGRTAVQLAHISPKAIIITISTNSTVAKKLQLYRGIIPIIYDKEPIKDWYLEMAARIRYAVNCGIKRNILRYGNNFVSLQKTNPTSAFNDSVSLWKVMVQEDPTMICPT